MIPVLTSAGMREADRKTIEEIGLPGAVLMENAGGAVARVVSERFPGKAAVLCGRGNNGGDGFVAARRLRDPLVLLFGKRAELKGDARLHMEAFLASGGTLLEVPDPAAWDEVKPRVLSCAVLVDALLGTGLREAPTGAMAKAIGDLGAGSPPVVAVDLPSGILSDSGEVPWETIAARVTVTFGAPKLGLVLPPACDRAGDLVVEDIGIPARLLREEARVFLLDHGDLERAFPSRAPGSHKGTYGHLLVLAGSVGRSGAAILAARGALRTGVGLVTVATPGPALPLVAAGAPELMTEALPVLEGGSLHSEAVARAVALARERDAVVLGPGLPADPATREFVRAFLPKCPVPVVVDAEGLNALAPSHKVAGATALLRRETGTVVTPHPGEMARLLGLEVAEIQRRRLESAASFAKGTGATVVLKGQRTVVSQPGGPAAVNPTGNPGMATGGMGDALAGIIGALLARGRDPWTAATAGVYLHGLAGDRARAASGSEGLLAGDLIEALPGAIAARA
jgi:NAD(P)H-hydrate epimerase